MGVPPRKSIIIQELLQIWVTGVLATQICKYGGHATTGSGDHRGHIHAGVTANLGHFFGNGN
jgi:hypothetical protein